MRTHVCVLTPTCQERTVSFYPTMATSVSHPIPSRTHSSWLDLPQKAAGSDLASTVWHPPSASFWFADKEAELSDP